MDVQIKHFLEGSFIIILESVVNAIRVFEYIDQTHNLFHLHACFQDLDLLSCKLHHFIIWIPGDRFQNEFFFSQVVLDYASNSCDELPGVKAAKLPVLAEALIS